MKELRNEENETRPDSVNLSHKQKPHQLSSMRFFVLNDFYLLWFSSDSIVMQLSHTPASPDHYVGNFVKVEQRIPVKILFTENNDAIVLAQLTSGMNVECKVLARR